MASKTCHLNVPTTKYKYRLPIANPQSPNPALTDYMKLSVVAPKSGSTTVGTLSLLLEVRAPNIDRGGGGAAIFSLANVKVVIIASGCTLVAGSQSPAAGTILGPTVTWSHASLTNGSNKDHSVDFQWPFPGKRSFDFVVSAEELERPGVITNVRLTIP